MAEFQSTLPREERPIINAFGLLPYLISIHAPTRGATALWIPIGKWVQISIHAPTRGATYIALMMILPSLISIHAPTRGATDNLDNGKIINAISIHAPTRGATHYGFLPVNGCKFQSTLPREERHTTPFNSAGGY